MQGRTFGQFQILEPLGAGGMGEVYRARDTRLGRDVAIKVLPEDLASDPERLARLEREAQLLASLNHPGIATIHGLEDRDEVRFLVLELVEGATLAEMLDSGRLEVEEAQEIARQIAEALAAAHESGIVHRDLKPANVKVTPEGRVKVLDFGLAKALRAEGKATDVYAAEGGVEEASTDISESPTAVAATHPGLILGTAAYMSPEQARGRPVDRRADIWAFGCVLYEMLTGCPPFHGETTTDILAALIERDPEWSALPEVLPWRTRDLLRRCLEKDPRRRLHDVSDARIEIEDALAKPTGGRAPAWPSGPPKHSEPAGRPELGAPTSTEHGVGSEKIDSIAVLPLQNLSGDAGQEYFSDGMTEALITDLAKIGALKVISRTSAMRYRGTNKSLPQIARELNVAAVVEGSVLRAGDRVRITAQLINAATDQHLWAESYDRDLGDILALQSEVARAIASEIQVKLTPQEDALLAQPRRVDPSAQEAYLKGLHYWNKTTKSRFTDAMEYFEQAIAKDPNHALAYAGLADSHWWSSFWGNRPPRQAFPLAREAAEKALAIDETLGEAHAALGSIHLMYDWDWEAAEREFERALELAPNSSSARICYSFYLTLMRRQDEAIAQTKRAQALDPLSGFSNSLLGHQFWLGRRYDEAIEAFEKWLLTEPNDWFTRSHLGLQYQAKGMIAEAIAEVDKGVELSGGVAVCISNAALVHYRSGDRQVADRLFEGLKQRAAHEYVQPNTFIALHRARGETDLAFEWVKKAHEERDSFLPWLRVTPLDFMDFPSDPRIDELLDRLGLP